MTKQTRRGLKMAAMTLAIATLAPAVALATSYNGTSGHGHRRSTQQRRGSRKTHGNNGHPTAGARAATLVDATLAPSLPEDPTLHGVAPGKLPWVLKSGRVLLKGDGKLIIDVNGLIIPSTGNAGPVKTVTASLYCGEETTTEALATTAKVPLSSSGKARIIEAGLKLPSACLAPVILIHPNGEAGAYIAAEGWSQ